MSKKARTTKSGLKKVESRFERWKRESLRAPAFFSLDDKEIVEIARRRQTNLKTATGTSGGIELLHILTSTKELIFDIENDKPFFRTVLYVFNTHHFEIELHVGNNIRIRAKTDDEIRNRVKHILALASGLDLPVYPNTEKVAPVLEEYYRDLLIDGFSLHDSSGQELRIRLANASLQSIENIDSLKDFKLTKMHSPAELSILSKAILKEVKKRDEAGRVLSNLRYAIGGLSELLTATIRNEGKLQKCLTRNPILFGPDYRRVIPKYMLGGKYEMDYALERVSGLVDLVEIESSNLPLFNKRGDPTSYLVHAEQQILDWLNWIERYNQQPREDEFPGLMQPLGYVVIGRSEKLSNYDRTENRNRLKRRNILFRGSIEILTYDDLLEKAKNLLRILEGGQSLRTKNV